MRWAERRRYEKMLKEQDERNYHLVACKTLNEHEWISEWVPDPRTISCGFRNVACRWCHMKKPGTIRAWDALAAAQDDDNDRIKALFDEADREGNRNTT